MELLPKTRVEVYFRVRVGRDAYQELMADAAKPELPKPVVLAFAPIHRLALGVAFGVVLGGLVFLMTAGLLLKGGYPIGPTLALLGHYFLGYTVTWMGAVVGFFWGFLTGFILGWGFALMHNLAVWTWLTLIKSRAEMEQYGDFLDHM
jgi:hypothetical protein